MAALAYPFIGVSSHGGRASRLSRPAVGDRPLLRLVSGSQPAPPHAFGAHDHPLAPPAPSRRAPGSPRRGASPGRRLAAGASTVAALVGVWIGAGALAGSGTPALARLPGSTRVAGGYAYVVRPGDTLWSIASRLEPSRDPRPLVDRLAAEVHGASLQAGSVIVVP